LASIGCIGEKIKKDKEEHIVQAEKAWRTAQNISQHKNHTPIGPNYKIYQILIFLS